jgi:2-polyprenyl-3-methyl-5-hydroxy-6-metoxy-1,4-benzoquinol methylase
VDRLDRCNLCGGSALSLFAEKTGRKTPRSFRIVTCQGCGLTFVSDRLSAEENVSLYDEAYFNGDGFDVSINYVMLDEEEVSRRQENEGVLAKIALLKPGKDRRILDVGCGTGCLVRALTAAGYEDVWGVELSEYAGRIARETTRAQVHVGDFTELPLPLAHFDVINATEVIEHVRDPLAFFRRVKELLAPGGVFIYSTGNVRGLYARLLGKRWPYLTPEGHLFYYDRSTLTKYFERVGLRSVHFATLDRPGREAYLSAEDQMAHSLLQYVGKSHPGFKGRVFRFVGALDNAIVRRAVTLVVGKHDLPVAVNPVGE